MDYENNKNQAYDPDQDNRLRSDIQIECVNNECKQPFLWTVGEQVFYASKNFQVPKKCPACRKLTKKNKEKKEKAEQDQV